MLLPSKSYLNFYSHTLVLLGFCLLMLAQSPAQAGTFVRINTSLGGLTLELFDDTTPITVTNFLNYVASGRYNSTVIHRSVPGFVLQGGWLTFDESAQTFNPLAADAAIVNEFEVSNTRGTIAMAKVGGNPNSATSQWFINLVDNTELDTSNGGFTVFGRVLNSDMAVVDAIAALPLATLLQGYDPFPVIGFSGFPLLDQHLVKLDMKFIENTTGFPNVYDAGAGILHTRVDTGSSGLLALAFTLYSVSPEVKIQAIEASVNILTTVEANMASFDLASNRLTIPEFVVDGVVAFRNVVFQLSDVEELLFTLVSAD